MGRFRPPTNTSCSQTVCTAEAVNISRLNMPCSHQDLYMTIEEIKTIAGLVFKFSYDV